ncbi:MAG: hypothetical protein HYX90_05310, partial [Chloroflexi bacterium]|nr:hypothetical protein [Chloroflexota bacterium]
MSTLLVLYPVAGAVSKEDIAILSEECQIPGLRLVLADDYILDSDRELFHEIIEIPPPEDIGETYDRLRRWCDKHHPDGIFMQSEAALPLGSLLARELSLPGPSVESAHLCVNKYRSRDIFSRSDVPTPHFCLAESASDVRRFARDSGYPVILKSVASALSHLVKLITCDDEVDA